MSSRLAITTIALTLSLVAGATSIVCDAGNYADSSGSYCMVAPGGSFTANAGDSLSVCPVGTFSDWGSTSCKPCPMGTISPAGASTCLAASSSSITSASVYGINIACPAGTFFTPTGCQGCAAGFASSAINAIQCNICPKNSFSIGNQAQCTACAAGSTTSSSSGATKCDNGNPYPYIFSCPAGFGMAPSRRGCQICPVQTYSDSASLACTPCAGGSLAFVAGSSTCINMNILLSGKSVKLTSQSADGAILFGNITVTSTLMSNVTFSSNNTITPPGPGSAVLGSSPPDKIVNKFPVKPNPTPNPQAMCTNGGSATCRAGFGWDKLYNCNPCHAGTASKGRYSTCVPCKPGTSSGERASICVAVFKAVNKTPVYKNKGVASGSNTTSSASATSTTALPSATNTTSSTSISISSTVSTTATDSTSSTSSTTFTTSTVSPQITMRRY